ncbi:MAG TPA: hypothetical protein PLL20_19910 [Phycisphaerae bacterium]|nr:hypothetical protein [Phycisphaerae bacterium]HRR85928.1 hypothetical protein [Phycisphaerae bacterium]
MSKHKSSFVLPWKPILYGLLALVGGVVLLLLSRYIKHKPLTSQPAAVTASAPAPATQPGPASPDRPLRRSRPEAAASGLSSLILLFSMACFMVFLICVGWVVVEIRNARPAWQRQTKYPKMRE